MTLTHYGVRDSYALRVSDSLTLPVPWAQELDADETPAFSDSVPITDRWQLPMQSLIVKFCQ